MRTTRHIIGALAAVGVLAGAVRPEIARAQDRLPIDRWLASSAFRVEEGVDPLDADVLEPPGETGVFPDRGRTELGADWSLLRDDGNAVFLLDPEIDSEPEPEGGEAAASAAAVVAYAHAYIKAAQDRTIRIVWGGVDCTRVAAWLNGRPLDPLGEPAGEPVSGEVPRALRAEVRIGLGYNTLLIKAVQGECPFGVAASLEAVEEDGLRGISVRASRPFGDSRTGPRPWIIAAPEAGPEALLGWQDETLYGAASVRLAGFAVTPIEGARVEASAAGRKVQRDVEWLTPAAPEAVIVPFEFDRLRTALLRDEGLSLKLKWDDLETETELSLQPQNLLAALHGSIRLLGWTPASGGGPAGQTSPEEAADGDPPHPLAHLIPLPDAAGVTLFGEWRVPGWLAGFSLRLDASGAPGSYRLDSRPVEGTEIVLCQACEKGKKIQIVVETTGAWERFPGAAVTDAGPPLDLTPEEAIEWLRLLDERGSREYRSRAAQASAGPAGD